MTYSFRKFIVLFAVSVALMSCAKPEVSIETKESIASFPMKFEGRIDGFDGITVRTSDTKAQESWKEGDVLYLSFVRPDETWLRASAEAYFSNNAWTITFLQNSEYSISYNETGTCIATYIENPNSFDDYSVSLSSESILYQDEKAIYTRAGNGDFIVSAILKPKTSRIRFKGDYNKDETIIVNGIKVYNYFPYFTGSSATLGTTSSIGTSVDKDGYTPYIYGVLDDEESRQLYLHINNNSGSKTYTLSCSDNTLIPGKTGVMPLPTIQSNNRWRQGLHFIVKGVRFSMYPNGYDRNFLAQTEVTEELYQTVLGNPTDSQLPQTNITRQEAINFTQKLTELLPYSFSLPYGYEWESAAAMSMPADPYSDYNNLDEVAWYAGNSSSLKPVMQKDSNSNGFYDMYGNAAEWIQDDTNYRYYYYGGSYKTPKEDFTSYNFFETTASSSFKAEDIGFRLKVNIINLIP